MTLVNNLKRRPRGQILHCSFYFVPIIAFLLLFELPLNRERDNWIFFQSAIICNQSCSLFLQIEY